MARAAAAAAAAADPGGESPDGGATTTTTGTPAQQKAPWWCWPLLTASVLSVSSAGVAFVSLPGVPPLTLAGWRLQLTSIVLAVCGSVQWANSMPADKRARFWRNLHLSAASGAALAVHFGTWVYSLQHTSLAHALLLVAMSPVLNCCVALLRRQRISLGEIAGSLLGLAGCAVLAAGAVAAKEAAVTLWGDLAAFAAAVAVVIHWHIGQALRSYQPVFVYSAPVTALAAVLLTLSGFLLETRSLLGAPGTRHGAFGWWLSPAYAPLIVYLGLVPGVIGHQGFNAVLKYVSPLLVSLMVQLEPGLGQLLGWALGVAAAPGVWTYVGGGIVLAATVGATLATARRQQQEEAHARLLQTVKHKSMRLPPDVIAAAVAALGGRSSYAALASADDTSTSSSSSHLQQHQQQLDHRHAALAAAESGGRGGGLPSQPGSETDQLLRDNSSHKRHHQPFHQRAVVAHQQQQHEIELLQHDAATSRDAAGRAATNQHRDQGQQQPHLG